MLQRSGAASSAATGGTSKPSISRRRGTVSNKKGYNTVLIILIVAVVLLVATLTLLVVVLSSSSSSTTTTATTRHETLKQKLAGVPNLLRGKIDPVPVGGNDGSANAKPASVRVLGGGAADKGGAVAAAAAAAIAQAQNGASGGGAAGTGTDYPYPLEPVEESYDIQKNFVVKGGSRFAEYTTGTAPYTIAAATRTKSDQVARSRRFHVKKAMKFAWDGYVKYAFGMDEIRPQSGTGSNGWGGQGITLVDSLDTLWLMGLKDEFWQARDWVRDNLDHSKVGAVSMFETTIRDLGGLLSAYDWSGDKVFLDKALDLGERLLHGFDNSASGIPFGQVALNSGDNTNLGWTGGNAILAEFGTIQIEYRYLARVTGRKELAEKPEKVFDIMHQVSPPNGLFPYYYRNNPRSGTLPEATNDKLTFGAMADSFYEYMLKVWIQGGKQEPLYREMYDKAMEGMHNELLQKSTPSGLTFIADKNGGHLDTKMDHLVCFMGGLLALGAYTDPLGLDSPRAQRDLTSARALTYTCYQMYARMNTGISAEFVQFSNGEDFQVGRGAPHYLLRPEAVESFFILSQLTGDPVYREWGWEVFQSIEKYCKTKFAYGALSNVQDTNGQPRDSMESFFLAETIKYLYLLQDPDTEIDVLHKHVFNTEAHPLRILPLLDQ
jgi:Glycosyl hydrolase family 47